MNIKESFEYLNIGFQASEEDIKKAYRKKASEYHPDKFVNDSEKKDAHQKFVKLQEAYNNVLSYKKTAKYDAYEYNFNDFKNNRSERYYDFGFINFEDFFQNHYKAKHTKNTIEKVANMSIYDFFQQKHYTLIISNGYEEKEVSFPLNNSDFNRNKKGVVQYKLTDALYNPSIDDYDDVIFKIILKGDINYTIKNNNLYFKMYLDPIDLILGGETIIDFVDGNKIKYRIPKCSKHTDVNKINVDDINLFIEYELVFPESINDKQKENLLNFKLNQS